MNRLWRHSWDVTPARAREIQLEGLLRESKRRAAFDHEGFARRGVLAAVDVAYDATTRTCFAALALWDVPGAKLIEGRTHAAPATFPYVPGLLTFREIPPLLPLLDSLEPPPDLILVDGQGTAHPRRFGVARHLGVLYDTPTLGWAKSRLIGEFGELAPEAGAAVPLMDKGEQIGWAFRSRRNCRPTFVSPGHLLSLEDSLRLARALLGRRRLCEPTREAHRLTGVAMREFRAGESNG